MNVRNCRSCGRLFNYVLGPIICPLCREEKEKKFQEVKEYVRDHRLANIGDVSKDCEVEVSQIHQWIREDRLQFAEDSPIRVACEKCGVMMRSGVYCDRCKKEMTDNLGSAYKKELPPPPPSVKKRVSDGDRMRFLQQQQAKERDKS